MPVTSPCAPAPIDELHEELAGEAAAGGVQQVRLHVRLDRREARAHEAAERVAHVEDASSSFSVVAERAVDGVPVQQPHERHQVDVGLAEVVADAEEVVEGLEEAQVHREEAHAEAGERAVDEAVGHRRAAEVVGRVLRARCARLAVEEAVAVRHRVDADRGEAAGGVGLAEADHRVALSAEAVLLDDDRPAARRRRALREDDRERDLRRVDDDRRAAAVAREALVGGLAGHRAGDEAAGGFGKSPSGPSPFGSCVWKRALP